jgi:hypothetical protein
LFIILSTSSLVHIQTNSSRSFALNPSPNPSFFRSRLDNPPINPPISSSFRRPPSPMLVSDPRLTSARN